MLVESSYVNGENLYKVYLRGDIMDAIDVRKKIEYKVYIYHRNMVK